MAEQQEQVVRKGKRVIPQTELDLQLLTTDPVIGKEEVSHSLKEKLTKYYKQKGDDSLYKEGMWGLLAYYTRDLRLANLSNKPYNNELEYAQYHLNLAGDLLQRNMVESFIVAFSRVATLLELSQSKGGFLRNKMNTYRQESEHRELEPPKKSLFGGVKKRGENQ